MSRAVTLSIAAVASVTGSLLLAQHSLADDSLKTITNPGGGEINYGSLTGQKTLQGAMQFILRKVHSRYGEAPDIGRLINTKDGQSMATFFTLTPQNAFSKKLAGLVIVWMPAADQAKAAVLIDSIEHFPQSQPVLMKKLSEAWRDGAGGISQSSTSSSKTSDSASSERTLAKALPLHEASGGDMSASIGLPEGWNLNGVSAGALHAVGPHGELVNLGVMIQNIYDPANPNSQKMIQYLRMGRNPVVVCGRNNSLAEAYCEVTRQLRIGRHQPAATINVISCNPTGPSQYETRAAIMTANIDLNEGKGPMFAHVRIGEMRGNGSGGWAMNLSGQMVPKDLVAQEWPTIEAMVASYKQDGRVIFAEGAAAIEDIHIKAAAAKQRADAFAASNDAHNRAVDARWDQQARDNKVFENYQLDRTIVQDNDQNTHITTGYNLGDALVNSNPSRFQYVPKANLVKGVDF